MKQIFLIATSVILLSGCSNKDSKTENVALVKQFVNEVINGGNTDLINTIWAENMQWHCAGLPDTNTRIRTGGESVGYLGRKHSKTSNIIFLCDNQGQMLSMGKPIIYQR